MEKITSTSDVSTRGGVVLVPEIWGVDDALRGWARRLADEGFDVVMPDLWWRTARGGGSEGRKLDLAGPSGVMAAVEATVDSEALADVRAALAQLPPDLPRFIMGFCIGGLYARMAACTLPGLAGAVEFYGRIVYAGTSPNKPVQPLDLIAGLGCPLQCHYGAEDPVAPPGHVDLLEQRLAGRSFPAQVFRYPACPHAFMNPNRPGYQRDAAELAWARALRFLDEHAGI